MTSTLHSFSASPPSLPELNSLQDDLEGDSEFNIFHLWSQLLGEMFDIFNWYDGALAPAVQRGGGMSLKGISIFTGTAAKEISTVRRSGQWQPGLHFEIIIFFWGGGGGGGVCFSLTFQGGRDAGFYLKI